MFFNKPLLKGLFIVLVLLFTVDLEAQSNVKNHAILVYPTRIVNRYFPVFSLGYLYHSDQRWAAGVNLGAVAEGGYLEGSSNFFTKKFNSIRGYDAGIEARWLLDRDNAHPLSFYAALEMSRAFTYRRYGITQPDANGVGELVNARVVARRNEFNVGFNKTWRFDFGLVVDVRGGAGLAGHSWTLTNKDLVPAPDATINDRDNEQLGVIGLNKEPKEVNLYPTMRIRLGIGWQL